MFVAVVLKFIICEPLYGLEALSKRGINIETISRVARDLMAGDTSFTTKSVEYIGCKLVTDTIACLECKKKGAGFFD